jgi:hypothetical protein
MGSAGGGMSCFGSGIRFKRLCAAGRHIATPDRSAMRRNAPASSKPDPKFESNPVSGPYPIVASEYSRQWNFAAEQRRHSSVAMIVGQAAAHMGPRANQRLLRGARSPVRVDSRPGGATRRAAIRQDLPPRAPQVSDTYAWSRTWRYDWRYPPPHPHVPARHERNYRYRSPFEPNAEPRRAERQPAVSCWSWQTAARNLLVTRALPHLRRRPRRQIQNQQRGESAHITPSYGSSQERHVIGNIDRF